MSVLYVKRSFSKACLQRSVCLCLDHSDIKSAKNYLHRDLPGGPVVKTPPFQHRRRRFHPWAGNRSHLLHGQRKKEKKKKFNYIDIFLPVLHHIIFQDLLVSSKEGCVFSRNTPKRPSFRVKLRSEFKSQSYQILALDFEPVISIPLVFIF